MIDIETRLRTGLNETVDRSSEPLVAPPVRLIHDGADRRRHRQMVLVRVAGVFVVLVTATGVWWSQHDNNPTISTNTSAPAVTPSTSVPAVTPSSSAPAVTQVASAPAVTPLTSRLFPADTNGTRPTNVFPGTTSNPASKRVDTQLWTANGQIVLAVRSDFIGGIVVPPGGSEHLNLPTWPDAEFATEANGTLSLYLHNLASNATSHVISRTLSRQDLLTIAASITPAADGPGIDIAPGAAPAGTTQTTHDTADIAPPVQFQLGAIGTQTIFFRLDAQTAAGRLFQQFFDQATPTTVGADPADIVSTAPMTTITWMPIPTVQASISVVAPIAIAVPIAQRVAASVHQVDPTTWNTLLTPATPATSATPDTSGASATTVDLTPPTTELTTSTVANASALQSAPGTCVDRAAHVEPETSPTSGVPARSEWNLDGRLCVTFDKPTNFVPDPKPQLLTATDRAGGLNLLQRWTANGNPQMAALSVQRDPGDDAPINKQSKPYDTITNPAVTWNLVDFGGTTPNGGNVIALARLDGYLIEITGTDQLVRIIINAVTLNAIG